MYPDVFPLLIEAALMFPDVHQTTLLLSHGSTGWSISVVNPLDVCTEGIFWS